MRISFIGNADPGDEAQAGTCIMVELGNQKFFFDFGSGCMRNIIAMGVALQTVNDFSPHLHVDLRGPAVLFAFAPWMGRWKPCASTGRRAARPRTASRR
jgi:hypothetical protein